MIKMIYDCVRTLKELEELFRPKTTAFVRELATTENLNDQYVSEYYFDEDTRILWVRMSGDEMTGYEIRCEEYGWDYTTILDEEPAYINYMNGSEIPFFEVVETSSISNESYMDLAEELMDLFKEGVISYADMMKALLDITVDEYNKTNEDKPVIIVPKYQIEFDEEELRELERITAEEGIVI